MQWINTACAQQGSGEITVNVPSRDWLVTDLEARLCKGEGFCLATLNLDHVVKLQHDKTFRDAYAAHTHITADGRPIVWLSQLAGQQIDLLPGSDLMLPLIALAERLHCPIGLFGASQDALETATARLQAQFPQLSIAATIAPPMGFDPEGDAAAEYIETLKASGARIVFVALGAPKQELFARRAYAAAPQIGFASIGAGVDFIAGTQTRAPRIMRFLAAEWLWRLAGNPKRLAGRYLACFAILPRLGGWALQDRLSGKTQAR